MPFHLEKHRDDSSHPVGFLFHHTLLQLSPCQTLRHQRNPFVGRPEQNLDLVGDKLRSLPGVTSHRHILRPNLETK